MCGQGRAYRQLSRVRCDDVVTILCEIVGTLLACHVMLGQYNASRKPVIQLHLSKQLEATVTRKPREMT